MSPSSSQRAVRAELVLVAALGLSSASVAASPQPAERPILVSAASSLTNVMQEITAAFERATSRRVDLNLGSSSSLARQILEGAPVDLFVSADAAQMERVSAGVGLAQGSRVDLLSNQLVVAVPADRDLELSTLADLQGEAVRLVAIADPVAVPAGVYTRQHLEALGLWESLEAKLVPTSSVRAVLAVVESANVDAGFVYRTDAATASRSRVALAVPLADGPRIVYPAAIVLGASNAATREFLTYLRGVDARAVFERAGFIVLPGSQGGTSGRVGPGATRGPG